MLDSISGSGTDRDPYQITTVKELQAISEDLSSSYELLCDIDAEETSEWNDGKGFIPIGSFRNALRGVFDGNNFEITNLHICRPQKDRVGLFGFNKGQIRNVKLIDASVEGRQRVGTLVGMNTGDIAGCQSFGTIVGMNITGGLVGENFGKISNSCTVVDNKGQGRMGSLVGSAYLGQTDSCWCVSLKPVRDENTSLIGIFTFRDIDRGGEDFSDFVISEDIWEISYNLDIETLYLQMDDNDYYCPKVPPSKAQSLLNTFYEGDIGYISDNFKSHIVSSV